MTVDRNWKRRRGRRHFYHQVYFLCSSIIAMTFCILCLQYSGFHGSLINFVSCNSVHFQVYFELKHHGPHLKKIIDDQQARLREAQKKLLKIQEKQPKLDDRIGHAVQTHSLLEQRLQNLRNLPGAHKKPLSRAERDFKLELGKTVHSFARTVSSVVLNML